jgi:predicted HicB family RNase H-like nuclease
MKIRGEAKDRESLTDSLDYKGYSGQFYHLEGDNDSHGVVLGTRDVIHFQGATTAELRRSLAEGVEDYLAWCDEEGKPPEMPYTGMPAMLS